MRKRLSQRWKPCATQKPELFCATQKTGALLSHPKQEFFCGTENGNHRLSRARACLVFAEACFAEALSAAKGQPKGKSKGRPRDVNTHPHI